MEEERSGRFPTFSAASLQKQGYLWSMKSSPAASTLGGEGSQKEAGCFGVPAKSSVVIVRNKLS